MKDIKLIALDLDGTLLDMYERMSERCVETIRRVSARQVKVVVCTGRNLNGINQKQMRSLGIRYVITANGSAIYDIIKEEKIYENSFSQETLLSILDYLAGLQTFAEIFSDGKAYVDAGKIHLIDSSMFVRAKKRILGSAIPKEDLSAFFRESGERVQKMTVALPIPESGIDVDYDEVYAHLRTYKELNVVDGGFHNPEVSAGSKAAGLSWLAEKLGIEKDSILAIGDSENDTSMLRMAGIGVAMGNAPAHVKAAADDVTASVDEDGAPLAMEKYVLNDPYHCAQCPRSCKAKRESGIAGVCDTDVDIMVARASLHMWEEPCITCERGSGTVFFSGCSLHCVYCQNRAISHAEMGKKLTVEELAKLFLLLQEKGAENINLVTPSHYPMQIRQALILAKDAGLTIPVVYNCGGYESVEMLKELDGLIDIYLTDFKYADAVLAEKYSKAKDYREIALAALDEMVRQCPKAIFEEFGNDEAGDDQLGADKSQGVPVEAFGDEEKSDEIIRMKKGVIVRHLLLPNALSNSKEAVRMLYERFGDSIYFSLMNQYTPMEGLDAYPELQRRVTEEEYAELVDYAIELGIENGFIQEGETAEESFIPDFEEDVFLKELFSEE